MQGGCCWWGCLAVPIVIGTFCLAGPVYGAICLFVLFVFCSAPDDRKR